MKILTIPSPGILERITANRSIDGQTKAVGRCDEYDEVHPDGGAWTDREPSNAVARALAENEGIAIKELPPVFDSVDTDGLDAVIQSAPDVTVNFSHYGYEVTVTGSGNVEVTMHPNEESKRS